MTPSRRRVALAAIRLACAAVAIHRVEAQAIDWTAVTRESVAHLQALIRINSTNPPGNELGVARYLEGVLAAAKIETHLFEPAPGRGSLVAVLKGNGAQKPVILMGHMDVVGVEREKWITDPFAAEVRDGYLYGRGSIDDKGMLVANLQAMLLLKRRLDAGAAMDRDVIFVANSDEEAGGEFGMGWLIANHPELIRAEFALNEGGRTRIVGGGQRYVALQAAEKVSHVVTVTARGPDGHASIPLDGNAVSRLGRALAAIGAHREPTVLTPTTTLFFRDLGRVWPAKGEAAAMADVASGDRPRVERGAAVLRRTPVLDAVLRNGISPTMLKGGVRSNVIPSEVSATLNVRTLPGESLDTVVARLKRAIRDSLVTLTVASRGEPSPAMPSTSALFTAVRDAARSLDPTIAVVPYLSTGATDSARLRVWGIQAYGLLPFPMRQDDEDRMHGNNERIPLEAFAWGIRFVYEITGRVSAVR